MHNLFRNQARGPPNPPSPVPHLVFAHVPQELTDQRGVLKLCEDDPGNMNQGFRIYGLVPRSRPSRSIHSPLIDRKLFLSNLILFFLFHGHLYQRCNILKQCRLRCKRGTLRMTTRSPKRGSCGIAYPNRLFVRVRD